MKQVLLFLGIYALCAMPLCAQAVETENLEVTPAENQQVVEVENTGALLLFQKQPVYEKQLQIIRVKKSGAITIFQINGKIKDSNDGNNGTVTWNIGGLLKIENGSALNLIYNNINSSALDNYTKDANNWWEPITDEKGDIIGWMNEESEYFRWMLKEALYYEHNIADKKSHKISINTSGGKLPHVLQLSGKDNNGNKLTNETDYKTYLENITVPTVNYNAKRPNFELVLLDNNGEEPHQRVPETGEFVIPVIYKPFFMEMCLFHFDDGDRFYLYGNVYNGRTWSTDEGFNHVVLNNSPVYNMFDNIPSDYILNIDDYLYVDKKMEQITGGGYSYTGNYFQYNARKITGGRELNAETYGLRKEKEISNFKLTIGCEHDENGTIYTNTTYATMKGGMCFNFKIDKNSNQIICSFSNSENGNKYDILRIKHEDGNITQYPTIETNGELSIKPALFKYFIKVFKCISFFW